LNTDIDLYNGCQKGNTDAQQLLYKRFAPVLKGICLRYFKDRDLCSDILHDSFIKIFDKIKGFNGEGSLEGWLKKIVVNNCIDYIRKQKIRPDSEELTPFNENQIEDNDSEYSIIENLMNNGFTTMVLFEMMHKLPERHRIVFNLFCIDQLSHKEIAEKLQISELISRKLVYKSKETLRNLLIEYVQQTQKGVNEKRY